MLQSLNKPRCGNLHDMVAYDCFQQLIQSALAMPLASLHNILMSCAGLALSRNANVSTDKHADKMVELGQLADDLREEYRELQTQMTDLIKQLKAETRRHKPD